MKKLFKNAQLEKMSIEALKAKSENTQDENLLSNIVGGLGFSQALCHVAELA
ncbi:hypothetical protein [Flavobacterium sp. NKUCC04_CG]|uniref:hypothetical protein n=1 Tax=Flavobacterium sp. NKUCC04_CG TaxID=2842121 RepID=UPI001C5B1193|nr:hypothetical protein [Flavobacterium sp. NKUCC04_CG]MBW3518971.1 hypothetical protein [Flavobacterium sp. NKUCC04_CG]